MEKTVSSLCGKCRECPHRYDCPNKRMEAAIVIEPKVSSLVTINMNTDNLDARDILKAIQRNIEKRCAFNKL